MSYMNNLNLFHLKYFIDAARGGGVSQSARLNFVTQSAVSRAIASLEENLGVELVVHRQNHFQLTEAGEAILENSQSIFDSVSQLKEIASGHLKTLRGPLRFGCNQAIASRLVAPALIEMEQRYPDVEPQIKIGNTDQIQHMLERREVDFGIVVDDGEVGNIYQTTKFFTDHLIVVKSPKFKKKDPFENFIVSRTQKGGLSQKYFREYEKVYGQALVPKIVISSWPVIMDFAIAGYGVALVPEFLCKDAIQSKKLEIVHHKVRPIPFSLCTIVNKNRTLPKNARALLECFGSSS